MAEELIGRQLRDGDYELRGVLGRGGMATVYRAFARSLDTEVAVKVLAPRLARDPGFRERFHDEARSLAGLHHPNLVEVYHYGEEGDLVYIVMRLVEGGTLKDRLVAGGPLDLVSTGRLIGQVAAALGEAHARGLVHLDIKPANILLGRADWPLLADFGITRAVGPTTTNRGQERLAGTPLYMPPEQCLGGPVDGRADQYALAVTTYELLTGARPFEGETTESVIRQQIETPPPRPRERNPGIPGPVEDALLRALAKDPEARYPTVEEFGQALTSAVEQTRGISLPTKQALAGLAPNVLAILALIISSPFLVGLIPSGSALLGRAPLVWLVQLVLALLVSGLYLQMRWPLIGVLTRLLSSVIDQLLWLPRGYLSSGNLPARISRWRNAVLSSTEGAVNLLYLFATYWLVGQPAVAIVGALTNDLLRSALATGLSVLVIVLALGVVGRLYRTSGPIVAAVILGLWWVMAGVLPTGDLRLAGNLSLAWTIKTLIGFAVFALLLGTRRQVQQAVRDVAVGPLGQLVIGARPGQAAGVATDVRRQVAALVGGALDFGYLLLGFGLLAGPVADGVARLGGELAGAAVVSALAGLAWLYLTLRLRSLGGTPGLALGVLLGAPLLVGLPILGDRILGTAGPGIAVTWLVGTAGVLVLAALRGPVQAVGREALGPVLERGVLGTEGAATEDDSARRVRALGRVAGALLDVALLVVGYWLLGVPLSRGLAEATHWPAMGSIVLALVILLALGLLLRPILEAARVIEETRARPRPAGRRLVPVLLIALISALVGGCAATPAVLSAPAVVGNLAVGAVAGPRLFVSWQYWQPWTPSHDQATYNLALACTDGQILGRFREAFRPAPGAAMPYGAVGATGLTDLSCDDWPRAYRADRQAAGLTASSSLSWDWLDVRAVVGPGGEVEVAETHHLLFTAGQHDHLRWSVPGPITSLGLEEDGQAYPFDATARPGSRYARSVAQGDQTAIDWWFPSVTSPATRTYTIRYRLPSALRRDSRGAFLDLPVLVSGRLGPTWRTTVSLVLPPGLGAGEAQLGSIGAPVRAGMIASRTAWFEAQDVPAEESLDLIVRFGETSSPTATPTLIPSPTATSTETATITSTPTIEQAVAAADAASSPPSPSSTATEVPATETPIPSATPTLPRPAATATSTPRPTQTPTLTVTPSPTLTATVTPVCAGDERMTFSPTNPVTGQPLTITVSSARNLSNVLLNGPDNPVGPTLRSDASGFHWDWQVTPSSAGRKDYYFFVANTGNLCTTNFVIVASPPPTPTWTPTATSTPCPPLANPRISAAQSAASANTVIVTWSSTGGCSPYTGQITAQYVPFPGSGTPSSRVYPISSQSGQLTDTPSQMCLQTINYSLALRDRSGQNVTAATSLKYCL